MLILVISKVFKFLLYFWLHWVFVASCRLSLIVASRGHSAVAMCRLLTGFSCCRAQALGTLASFSCLALRKVTQKLWHVESSRKESDSVAVACGIFMDQGSNLCPLSWQEEFYLLLQDVLFWLF